MVVVGLEQHKTMEDLLERGEKIDSLVDKSADLRASSKQFYKQVHFFSLSSSA